MSEVAVEQAPVVEAVNDDQMGDPVDNTATGDKASGEAKSFDEDYVKSLRSEAAKYRTQARENAEKAKAYDEYVQSQKTEQEQMAEALDAASRERDSLRTELMRMKVAQEKQLPASLVDRLRGDSEEEMLADADALLEGLKSSLPKPKPSAEQTGAGVVGDADAPTDPLALAAAVRGRR